MSAAKAITVVSANSAHRDINFFILASLRYVSDVTNVTL
jgi:hypothetical protein